MLAGSQSPMLRMAEDIALRHHERWDGTGYPAGLAETTIPETARIVSIVDVYDALTHDRVYRPAFPDADVLRMMREGHGTQFDPRLLDCFFGILPAIRRIANEHPDDAPADDIGELLAAFGGAAAGSSPLPELRLPVGAR